jgi:hypothetical protein
MCGKEGQHIGDTGLDNIMFAPWMISNTMSMNRPKPLTQIDPKSAFDPHLTHDKYRLMSMFAITCNKCNFAVN